MCFPSEKDTRHTILYTTFITSLIVIYIFDLNLMTERSLFGIFVSAVLIGYVGLLIWTWFGTEYEVFEGNIKIKSGPFRKRVKIDEIKRLRSVKKPTLAIGLLSGPALSREMLEIQHGKHVDVINISPKSEREFIEMVVAENSEIRMEEK